MSISYKKFVGHESYLYRAGFSRLSNMNQLSDTILTCAWSPIIWRGNAANTANFESSAFLALDFDVDGDMTLNQVNDSLADHKRIIATTKSHQILKGGICCDRYRLIVPFESIITDYKTYLATYIEALKKYPWADPACKDGARFFFPSKTIVAIDRESEYKWSVVQAQPDPIVEAKERAPVTGKIPAWCLDFINRGTLDRENSRNVKVFKVVRELMRQGFAEHHIRQLIKRAPIDWNGVQVEPAIKSARKYHR